MSPLLLSQLWPTIIPLLLAIWTTHIVFFLFFYTRIMRQLTAWNCSSLLTAQGCITLTHIGLWTSQRCAAHLNFLTSTTMGATLTHLTPLTAWSHTTTLAALSHLTSLTTWSHIDLVAAQNCFSMSVAQSCQKLNCFLNRMEPHRPSEECLSLSYTLLS